MSALDELLGRWRSNPDADATIALSSYLGTSPSEDLIREVSASADTWHAADGRVMLAVGRMHLDAGFLAEAQAALVAAGRANGRDGKPFRYLGEVLLRRGDALRAEKVLARAIQLSPADPEARLWHDRSVVYSSLQKRIGVEAVAAEVSRTMPKATSLPPPAMALLEPGLKQAEATNPRTQSLAAAAQASPDHVSELPRFGPQPPPAATGRREAPAFRPAPLARPARATSLGMGPPGPKLPSTAPPRSAPQTRPVAPPARARPTTNFAAEPPHRFDDVVTTLTPSHRIASRSEPAPASARASFPKPAPVPPATSRAPSLAGLRSATAPAPYAPLPPPPDPLQPDPNVVLEHLSRVGVFEPGGGAPPAWENPARPKTRGTWTLLLSIVLIAAAGSGSYAYSQNVRGQRVQRASSLNHEVERLLQTGSVSDLRLTDQKLNTSFELDSLSPRAARLWLQNRVLYELLTGDEARGIDAAVHRGKTVGLPDQDTAFGKVAALMTEGDLGGGVAALARWDKGSARDPYYQLVAGAVLERAGDLRAIDRYEAARRLDPDFVPAQLLLARLLLLEFDAERAKAVLTSLRAKLGSVPITRALSALSWVVDPARPETPPEDAKLEALDLEKLPAPLSGVPAMVEALQAMRVGDGANASRAIDSAVMGAMTPSLATGLGFLAIEAGDEQLARKAALRALQFAVVYPRARTLAARVALLGGRLDEAKKAVEELDPSSPDALVVRGVVAYESADPGELTNALRALGGAALTRQTYSALAAGPGLLTGRAFPTASRIEAMATPATTWGELIATDAALDLGDLPLAAKILGRRQGGALRPVHYARLARLNRYRNEVDAARSAAAAAGEGAMTLNVLLESVYAMVANKDHASARNLAAKHADLLGPLSAWVAVLVDADDKPKAQVSARAAKLALPPAETPLTLRILVLRALAASGDKRGHSYVVALAKQAPKHPDVIEAALELK